MNPSISIREYHSDDKPVLMEIIRLNTPEFFGVKEEDYFNEYLDKHRKLYYSVLDKNKVIGCGGINFADDGKRAVLSWAMFHPDYQRKGLGGLLLKHRIHIIKTYPKVEKITVRTSQMVYLFFEKRGFELIEIRKDYWAEGLDLYYMEYRD